MHKIYYKQNKNKNDLARHASLTTTSLVSRPGNEATLNPLPVS